MSNSASQDPEIHTLLTLTDVRMWDNAGSRGVTVLGSSVIRLTGVVVSGHDVGSAAFLARHPEAVPLQASEGVGRGDKARILTSDRSSHGIDAV